MTSHESIRIPLLPVVSSNLEAIGYDDRTRILAVQFRSGHIHHYAGVAAETALELLGAESKGKYYAATIKGRYQAERMTGVCPDCGDIGRLAETCADCGCAAYVDNRPTSQEQIDALAPIDVRD